jgi:hypothetical protein
VFKAKKNEKISLTKEGTGGKDGYDERSLRRSDPIATGKGLRDRNAVTKSFKPVRHLLEPGDGTGIITEEDSSKCSETSLQ